MKKNNKLHLLTKINETLLQYFEIHLVSFVFTIAIICRIYFSGYAMEDDCFIKNFLVNDSFFILCSLAVGCSMCWLFIGKLILEKMQKKKTHSISRVISSFLSIAIVCFLLFTVTLFDHEKDSVIVIYLVFFVLSLLAIPVCVCSRKGEVIKFWNFNVHLVVTGILVFLLCGVLSGSLSSLLLALTSLLDIDFSEEFVGSMIVFNLIFIWSFGVLASIPSFLKKSNKEYTKNRVILIYGKYISFPILILYLIVLYVYGAKIFIKSELPNGEICYLILAIAIYGEKTMFVLQSFIRTSKNRIVRNLLQIYHLLLLPLLVLMFYAIGFRISEYGVTLSRYYLLLAEIWMLIITVYFIFRKRDIRFIYWSLIACLFFSLFSPWNAFRISRKSQTHRFFEILDKHELLYEGKLVHQRNWIEKDEILMLSPVDSLVRNDLPRKAVDDLESIARYLYNNHELNELFSVLTQNLPTIKPEYTAHDFIEMLNLYSSEKKYTIDEVTCYFPENSSVINVKGIDYYLPHLYMGTDDQLERKIGENNFVFSLKSNHSLSIQKGDCMHEMDLMPIVYFIQNKKNSFSYLYEHFDEPAPKLKGQMDECRFEIVINQVDFAIADSLHPISRINFDVFIADEK